MDELSAGVADRIPNRRWACATRFARDRRIIVNALPHSPSRSHYVLGVQRTRVRRGGIPEGVAVRIGADSAFATAGQLSTLPQNSHRRRRRSPDRGDRRRSCQQAPSASSRKRKLRPSRAGSRRTEAAPHDETVPVRAPTTASRGERRSSAREERSSCPTADRRDCQVGERRVDLNATAVDQHLRARRHDCMARAPGRAPVSVVGTHASATGS